jgi:hypothetical protein
MFVSLGAIYGCGEGLTIGVASTLGKRDWAIVEVGVALELACLHAPSKTANNNIKMVKINNICRLRISLPYEHDLPGISQPPGRS